MSSTGVINRELFDVTYLVSSLDTEDGLGARIIFDGTFYHVSGIYAALTGSNWLSEGARNRISGDFQTSETAQTAFALVLAEYLLTKFTKPGKAISTVSSLLKLATALRHHPDVTPDEAAYFMARLAVLDYDLGRSIITAETPNGQVHLGNRTDTPTSLLNLAGISYNLGLNPNQVDEIMRDRNHPRYREVSSYLANMNNSSSGHATFLTNVIDFLEENHHLFPEIPESYFEERIFPFDNLPLDVLERLFEHKGITTN